MINGETAYIIDEFLLLFMTYFGCFIPVKEVNFIYDKK